MASALYWRLFAAFKRRLIAQNPKVHRILHKIVLKSRGPERPHEQTGSKLEKTRRNADIANLSTLRQLQKAPITNSKSACCPTKIFTAFACCQRTVLTVSEGSNSASCAHPRSLGTAYARTRRKSSAARV